MKDAKVKRIENEINNRLQNRAMNSQVIDLACLKAIIEDCISYSYIEVRHGKTSAKITVVGNTDNKCLKGVYIIKCKISDDKAVIKMKLARIIYPDGSRLNPFNTYRVLCIEAK